MTVMRPVLRERWKPTGESATDEVYIFPIRARGEARSTAQSQHWYLFPSVLNEEGVAWAHVCQIYLSSLRAGGFVVERATCVWLDAGMGDRHKGA
ncbi:hypothetical protein MHYP_G00003230 [Metynnis hypsauchen]